MSLPSFPVEDHSPSRWRFPKGPLQAVLFIAVFSGLSQCIARLGITVNAGPIGFFVVLAALSLRVLPVGIIEQGAKWLIAQGAVFMIPPVVAVARAWHLLEANWLPLAVIIVGGTLLTTTVTALAVEVTCRMMRGGAR
jgi:holin-like protein